MGGAVSKNVVDITTEAISSEALSVMNGSKASSGQDQMISVSNVKGNVVISGNKMNQQATINTEALLKNLNTQKSQQDLSVKIAQAAKSVVSGINLGQFTDAENTMNAFMLASTDMTTNITQSCATSLEQSQKINVDIVEGNVSIKDNQMGQIGNIFQKCVTDNLSDQASIQQLQNNLDQSATAESKGFSVWALVIMALIALLFVILPIILPFSGALFALSKFLFPIMFLAGIVMIALFFTMKKPVMVSYGFSNLLQDPQGNLRCGAVILNSSTDFSTASSAETACLTMENATAYDWKGYNIDAQGNAIPLQPPITTFYSGASRDNCPIIKNKTDNMRIIRMPKVAVSASDPRTNENPFSEGDIYIDPQTTKWYKLINTEWKEYDPLVDSLSGKISFDGTTFGTPTDSSGTKGDVIVKFADSFSPFFNVYTKGDTTWDVNNMTVPGFAPNTPSDINGSASFNTTGFKSIYRDYRIMGIGIALTIVGLFGTFVTFLKKDPAKKSKVGKALAGKTTVGKALVDKVTSGGNNTSGNKAVENKAVENKAVENKAVENKAVENKAVENKAVENNTNVNTNTSQK